MAAIATISETVATVATVATTAASTDIYDSFFPTDYSPLRFPTRFLCCHPFSHSKPRRFRPLRIPLPTFPSPTSTAIPTTPSSLTTLTTPTTPTTLTTPTTPLTPAPIWPPQNERASEVLIPLAVAAPLLCSPAPQSGATHVRGCGPLIHCSFA